MLASEYKDMIRSISGVGVGQDLFVFQVKFSLPYSRASCFPLQAGWPSSWTFSPIPERSCPCKESPPPAMPTDTPQGRPLPTMSINLASMQNQCPFIAANALITGMSLAVTYLSHYTLIIQGNFKQID